MATTEKQRKAKREYMRKWRDANREHSNELARQSRERRKRDPKVLLKRVDLHLRRSYGMTYEEYEARLLAQDGVCAICGKEPGKRRHHVDHNHDTGEIRGLLCFSCNTKLGWLEDFFDVIWKYLRR